MIRSHCWFCVNAVNFSLLFRCHPCVQLRNLLRIPSRLNCCILEGNVCTTRTQATEIVKCQVNIVFSIPAYYLSHFQTLFFMYILKEESYLRKQF